MPRRSWPDLLRLDRPALGTWSQIASEECVDMLGAAGFDFAIIDCEHGAFGIETAERLIRACDASGLVPLVRVATPEPFRVGQALDGGAAAVVAPGVCSAAQAQVLVAASRFAPSGTRGACPCVRAGDHFIRDWPSYERRQRESAGVVALVETAQGVENIEAICAVEGLLAVLVGPFDLSVSLGFQGDYLLPEVQSALARMVSAARAEKIPVIAPIFDPDLAAAQEQRARWLELGATMFVVGTDKILFGEATRRYAAMLR